MKFSCQLPNLIFASTYSDMSHEDTIYVSDVKNHWFAKSAWYLRATTVNNNFDLFLWVLICSSHKTIMWLQENCNSAQVIWNTLWSRSNVICACIGTWRRIKPVLTSVESIDSLYKTVILIATNFCFKVHYSFNGQG